MEHVEHIFSASLVNHDYYYCIEMVYIFGALHGNLILFNAWDGAEFSKDCDYISLIKYVS